MLLTGVKLHVILSKQNSQSSIVQTSLEHTTVKYIGEVQFVYPGATWNLEVIFRNGKETFFHQW